jgi:hypothetical protein
MFETRKTCAPDPHADIPLDEMTAQQCLAVITHAQDMKSHYDAREAQALARFAELRQPTQRGSELAEGARDEVAMELGVSPRSAASKILQARSLVTRLPATVAALSDGKIDYKRALSMTDLTTVLSDRDALTVEQKVLNGGRRSSPSKFRDAIRYQVIKTDPRGAERRRTEARLNRNVTIMPIGDSMCQLTARLSAEESLAAHQRITILARRAKSPGRTLAQCRADVLMDLIMGKDRGRVDVQMFVTVPITTLMMLNNHPGVISGYGPITADHARELARNATWRRIITDPSGLVQETSPCMYPSPSLTDHIRSRDDTCHLTGCSAPAEEVKTARCSGSAQPGQALPGRSGLCRYHSVMSERSDSGAERSGEGAVASTTDEGHTYATIPEQRDAPPC